MRKKMQPVRSVADRNALVEKNMGLVYWSVNRMIARHPGLRLLDYDDLVGHSTVVMIRAAETWREDGGSKFATYAALSLERGMQRLVGEYSLVRLPYRHAMSGDAVPKFQSLDVTIRDFPTTTDDPHSERAELCRTLLGRINPRHARIVNEYYFAELSIKEISRRHRITRDRVSRILALAIADMRAVAGSAC